ncbi:MAG: hypothetical protein BA863_00115 [Desulfovibrio sp. S3730MH75]|nr:MAG: hypothetical protein BA863_00115 [Desulfovibrio sp. S3730MH75]
MKVSIIEPVGSHGGMDYYDFGLCSGLAKAGVEISLYTCDETRIKNGGSLEIVFAYQRIFGGQSKWLRGARYIKGTLHSLIKSRIEGVRICHFHFFHVGILELFNVIMAKILRMRVVITAHDVETFVSKLPVPGLVRLCYSFGDRIVAHNRWSEGELLDKVGVPQQKISIIPHGNYVRSLGQVPDKLVARNQLGIQRSGKVLLCFGQIKKVKGLDLLLNALPEVIERHPDTILVIAGKVWKDDYSRYKRIIEKYGLGPYCIEKIQYIPNEEVALYYAAADLVVLPYRRIYQSGVLLMAMSYGKPVLASDLEGMKEIVRDNQTGFLFETGNIKSLSDRLNDILSDSTKMTRVASSGYDLIRTEFSWKRVGAMTAECYESLCL